VQTAKYEAESTFME